MKIEEFRSPLLEMFPDQSFAKGHVKLDIYKEDTLLALELQCSWIHLDTERVHVTFVLNYKKKKGHQQMGSGPIPFPTFRNSIRNVSSGGSSSSPSPTATPSPESPAIGAPGPSPDCFTNLLNLSDCLTFVEEGSNLTTPEKPCCGELAGLVESTPQCLCDLLGKSDSLGITLNTTKALALPGNCGVSTPDPSLCAIRKVEIFCDFKLNSVYGIPIGVPPSSSPGLQPTIPGSPQGSLISPESGGGKDNGASSIAFSARCILAGWGIALLPTLF
ncbi:Bifunctional inhibitor/plant lipid transfer protein/seed storage helical domain [Dillenia turbinata]|uniref:Bifunctional inhibitor/plant lipid transfer protein/seed storage helical domain n=1 Tax=Dillenia turbinata TaxID=194707 RepID=A0AAN8V0T7_9MAGN